MAAVGKSHIPTADVPEDIFSSLDGLQLYTFKEMFNFIDFDKDGRISDEDLERFLANLGQPPEFRSQISEMLEGHEHLNFADFLAMFANRTVKDSENVIRKAFRCLDETGSGKINANRIKELLVSGAHRLTVEQVRQLFEDIAVDQEGMFDYDNVTKMLLEGPEDAKAGPNS